MAKKLALNSKIGILGEDIAAMFLMKHGFKVIYRNYLKKWGEIDIIAKKGGKLYFVEVKSVSYETLKDVNRETSRYNPAENIHNKKLKRLSRVIQSYLLEYGVESEWQLDVLLVYIDLNTKEVKIETLNNVIC